jgi:Na+-transporting methylmalonyl-CoA/oxaloacetate decarboxylase gamma subunit
MEVALSSAVNFIWSTSSPKGATVFALLSILAWAVWRLVPYVGQAFVAWVKGKARVAEIEAQGEAEVARIEANGEVLRILAELEPDQVERLHGRLERVRPPPDEIEPPAASSG